MPTNPTTTPFVSRTLKCHCGWTAYTENFENQRWLDEALAKHQQENGC